MNILQELKQEQKYLRINRHMPSNIISLPTNNHCNEYLESWVHKKYDLIHIQHKIESTKITANIELIQIYGSKMIAHGTIKKLKIPSNRKTVS